jgi:hypothetical protein
MKNYSNMYIQNIGQYKTAINGNIIDNGKWSLDYDGNQLNLEAKNNDKAVYMNLNNDEILKLFEVPAYHKTIDNRLQDILNLNDERNIDIEPIIIEEIEKIVPRKKKSTRKHKSKHNSKSKSKSKSKGKGKSKSLSKSVSKSKSVRRSDSKSKKNSHHKTHPDTITPDYLKTIY